MAEITVGTPTFTSHTFDVFGARPIDPDTALAEVPILDHGRVALLVTYGSDAMIANTARVSYGKGTKTVSSDAGLIRYLMRHRHTSPFEHAEAVFYLRIPIIVARQLVRHRTANINEYSARYSELSDDFYVPDVSQLTAQSAFNKQGRDDMPLENADELQWLMRKSQQSSLNAYKALMHDGVSRELARTVTGVGTYTELYWKCDLHNLLHFLKLRLDAHAQYEIRLMAHAMYACVREFFPHTCGAWEDYVRDAYTLSAAELRSLAAMLPRDIEIPKDDRMSTREYEEFVALIQRLCAR